MKWYLAVVLICISLVTSEVADLFIGHSGFPVEVPIQAFCPFFYVIVCFSFLFLF